MGLVLMDTDAAAGLVESYGHAGRELAGRAAGLARLSAQGAPVTSADSLLGRLGAALLDDADELRWTRLWLLETDAMQLGSHHLGSVPDRTLRSETLDDLIEHVDEAGHLDELAIRALGDPRTASTIVQRLGGEGIRDLMLAGDSGIELPLAVLLAAASRSPEGLSPETLAVLLPDDATHAAARIAAFGRMLLHAHFSAPVIATAAAWITEEANRPHLELAMNKYGTNVASAVFGAVAGAGAAALIISSASGSSVLSALADPQAAFELRIDGDEAAANLIDALGAAAGDGSMDAGTSFELWLQLLDHLDDNSLPGPHSRLALAHFTNQHWDEIRLLSTDVTAPLFAELTGDDTALATLALELGARSTPLIADAAEGLRSGRDISAQVELMVSGYDHVFNGIMVASRGRPDGGLVASALDTAISTAVAPAGPAVAWVGKNASRELLDHVLAADHPRGIATPRELFEHEFRPSNTAVPDGSYPAVSAFEIQVFNEVLRVEPKLVGSIVDHRWFDGNAVAAPVEPSDQFAEWFARTTSGSDEVAERYQALRSRFADKVLLEVLAIETG